MENKIEITLMQEEHIKEVSAIEMQLFSRPWTEENFRESIKMENTIFVVAKMSNTDEVVGYCGLYQSFEDGDITNVAVKKSSQRQGVAKKMLVSLLRLAKERGIDNVMLEVRQSNVPAISLYEKIGFVNIGVRKGFYIEPKEDANLMQFCGLQHFPLSNL